MAETAPLGRDHVWFADARTDDRRLRVSSHPHRRLVVLSFWQGDGCTGTFRLPVEDAPRLIALLAADLEAALSAPAASGAPGGATPRWARRRRWWGRARQRARSRAEAVGPAETVIDLDRHR